MRSHESAHGTPKEEQIRTSTLGVVGEGAGHSTRGRVRSPVQLVVNHRLPFALHLAHLLLHRRRIELLLDHIAQQDRFAAIRTEHLPLAAGSQRFRDRIPTGFRLEAQGCEVGPSGSDRATLGNRNGTHLNPQRGCVEIAVT
ncbi:MAG: hypothetical protein HY735_11640 [Verrucomicrobia bacterium]|nr:hypothetical protein [Verrucomicrobiota bacterium]